QVDALDGLHQPRRLVFLLDGAAVGQAGGAAVGGVAVDLEVVDPAQVEADGRVTFEIQVLGHSRAVPLERGLTPRCLASVAPISEKVSATGSSRAGAAGPKNSIGMCSRVWSEPGQVGSQPWSAVITTRSPSLSLAMNSGRRASSSCSAFA